jgi:formate hydrogenlyase subunit 3/multisubunit Na+/H+ antiporter MnhD subunit
MILLVLFCILGLLATGVVGAVRAGAPDGGKLVYGMSLGLCAMTGLAGVAGLAASAETLALPLGLPWVGMHLRLDALAGFFLFVVNLGGAGASLFALGYGRHEAAPGRVLPFYPVFLAGLDLVVIADDAFTFLFAWELMSLASWALVVAHHHVADNLRAGYVYLLMASLSGLALLLAFGLLAGPAGSYGFAAMRAAPPSAGVAGLVLMLALIGAGSKAGLIPLHAWLPLAHPAAPSHVSALMSGVMTKVAVYAFVRIAFDLLGPPAWWSAVVVLAVGGITAVLGVLYALMQHDLKRLLAYHTVENIGIIFIGLGLAMAFRANGFAAGAALALTAALFHVFNHAVFKSLLFFGSGAVLVATGERDMEQLGGLIHRMPRTAIAFLVGCAAISALPPLNGFVSEWLTFQAILLRPDLPQWGLKVMIPTDGALLALAAALAAACFVKAFGVTFLGRPRCAAAARAVEVDRFSLAAMLGFAALCLVAGVLPGLLIDALAPVAHALLGVRMPTQLALPWISIIPIEAARSSYNGLLIFLFVAATTSLTIFGVHRFASQAVRRAPAWDCGFPDARPATQYTADSFAQPIRRVFGTTLFRAQERVTMPPPGDMAPARIEKTLHDPIWETLYLPVARGVAWAAEVMNHLQFLTIRRYLGFVFAALVALLLALALWQ